MGKCCLPRRSRSRGAHGPGFGCLSGMEEGGSFVILRLKVISALVLY